jgi:hypothetical protein
MLPDKPNTNHCADGWAQCRDPESPQASFTRGNSMRERFRRWMPLLGGLLLSAMFIEISIALGAQRYLPSMLLGLLCGLVLIELARYLLVRSRWPLFRSPAARRLAAALGFVPSDSTRSRFHGPRP